MQFDIGVPSGAIKHYDSWVGDGVLADFAVAAERRGFDSVHVTDHPFPEDGWLANGGHHAFDPFVALSTMAAVTSTIKLRTNLLVAGYRHPFLAARAVSSLDRLSGGRMIVGMGAGYLQAEFDVLSADFDGRGPAFDEAIVAMTAAWTGESVQLDGERFPASGHTMLPTPMQRPRPPIWIGGNSGAARRRAATLADGWIPMPAGPGLAKITRTATLQSLDEVAAGITQMHQLRADAGIEAPFDVAIGGMGLPTETDDTDAYPEAFARLADAGITWVSLPCRGRSLEACVEEIEWLGEHVIAPHRSESNG